jgi:transposase
VAAVRQAITQLPAGSVVLAEDETHLNLLAWVRATWVARGARQQVMTPGTNRRRSVFGAIDLASGRFLYRVARKAVSATFIAFLEQLLAAYPATPLVAVVCDNVIIHHSKLVQCWLAAHPRVVVWHGARYSPHDNPTERIWGALKAWLANNPTLTIQGRVRQVHAFFRQRTPAQLLATAAPGSSPWLPGVTDKTSGRLLRVCYRATRTGQEAWWMTLPATLPSTAPATLDLPLLPMTMRSVPILAAASAIACPSWPSGASGISLLARRPCAVSRLTNAAMDASTSGAHSGSQVLAPV